MDKYSLIYSRKILFKKIEPSLAPQFLCGLWCQTDFMYKI